MTPGTAQLPLKGFGPMPDDAFRFTWWNTAEGAGVWVGVRGSWRQGVIVGRGRKYVEVAIATRAGRQIRVRKPYSELRRQQTGVT